MAVVVALTTIKTAEQPGFLRHEHSVMLVGSCFSDNIGQKMRGAMMRALVNPMGTIYWLLLACTHKRQCTFLAVPLVGIHPKVLR